MNYLDLTDIITGARIYVDGDVCGDDVEFTLPSQTRKTVSYDTIGLEVPIPGRADSSTLKIHKIGMDGNYYKLCMGGVHVYQLRWVLQYIQTDGSEKPVGCYCYVKGRSKGIPESGGKVGDSIDSTIEISPIIIRIVIDGTTYVDIDKLAGKFKIYGEDEAQNIEALL